MATLDKLSTVVAELETKAFSVPLSIPDATMPSGTRPPLLSEIGALEMSVCLVEGGVYSYITAWIFSAGTWAVGSEVLKNVDIKNVGRGQYDQVTGRLFVTLHAGDSPCVSTGTAAGVKEIHEAIITVRYNLNVDQNPKRVQFRVENLNKVPREP